MADIWALTFSDVVLSMHEQKDATTEWTDPIQEVVEQETDPITEPAVAEQVIEEPAKEKTLEEIHQELQVADEKNELHKKLEETIEENKKTIEETQKKPISPEVAEQLEQILPSFYKMYDEVVDERNRYKIAFETLSWKYEKLLTENEDMKYSLRKTWDVDDDIKYLAKLKKDENATDEYVDNLIWELSKAYKLNEYDLRRDIKEKRQRQLQALSWVVETKTVVEETTPEQIEEIPLFSGFKINNKRAQKK